MAETTETTTFKIYIRVGDDGSTAAVTEYELEHGTDLDSVWNTDGVSAHRDIVIEVTAPLPVPPSEMEPMAAVTVPDAPAPAIAAAPA